MKEIYAAFQCVYIHNQIMNTSTHGIVLYSFDEITDSLLTSIQSTWLIDSLYLFVVAPLGLFGFVSNLFSFSMLLNLRKSRKCIYQYLRVYTLASALLSAIFIVVFYGYSPRYFLFAFDSFARINRCVVVPFVSTTLYFFANILDVLMALERLSLFVTRLKRLKKLSPYLISVFLLAVCTIVNLPAFFLMELQTDEQFLASMAANVSNHAYCKVSPFFITFAGKCISFLVFILLDWLTFVLETIFSVLCAKYLLSLRHKVCAEPSIIPGAQIPTTSTATYNGAISSLDSDSKLVSMTSFLLLLSITSHIFVLFSIVSNILKVTKMFNGLAELMTIFGICFKSSLNFIVIFFYSRVFRNNFKRLIRLKKKFPVS